MWRATICILTFAAIAVVAACGQSETSPSPLAPTSVGPTATSEPTTTTAEITKAGSSTSGTTGGQATTVPMTAAISNPCRTLTIKPVTQTVPACGTPMTSIALNVTANSACRWANSYRVNSSQPSWIYPVPIVFGGAGNGTLRLSLNANYSGATRTGSITLLAAGVTATLTQPKCR
jgi:hypothetical protein